MIQLLAVLGASVILGGSLIVAAAQLARGPRFVPVSQGTSPFFVFDREAKQVCWAGKVGSNTTHTPCYRSHGFEAPTPTELMFGKKPTTADEFLFGEVPTQPLPTTQEGLDAQRPAR